MNAAQVLPFPQPGETFFALYDSVVRVFGNRCKGYVVSLFRYRARKSGETFYETLDGIERGIRSSYKRRSIITALNELRRDGVIVTRSDGRGFWIQLKLNKPEKHGIALQKCKTVQSDINNAHASDFGKKSEEYITVQTTTTEASVGHPAGPVVVASTAKSSSSEHKAKTPNPEVLRTVRKTPEVIHVVCETPDLTPEQQLVVNALLEWEVRGQSAYQLARDNDPQLTLETIRDVGRTITDSARNPAAVIISAIQGQAVHQHAKTKAREAERVEEAERDAARAKREAEKAAQKAEEQAKREAEKQIRLERLRTAPPEPPRPPSYERIRANRVADALRKVFGPIPEDTIDHFQRALQNDAHGDRLIERCKRFFQLPSSEEWGKHIRLTREKDEGSPYREIYAK